MVLQTNREERYPRCDDSHKPKHRGFDQPYCLKIRRDATIAASLRSVQELEQPALPAPSKMTKLEHKKDDREDATVYAPWQVV